MEKYVDAAIETLAAHYVKKIISSGMNPTEEEIKAAVMQNWPKIAREAAKLASMAASL